MPGVAVPPRVLVPPRRGGRAVLAIYYLVCPAVPDGAAQARVYYNGVVSGTGCFVTSPQRRGHSF